MDGNGNATGFDWRGTQFTMGADTELEAGTVLGAALGYGRGTASPDAGGSTKTKSPRVSVYGSHDLGAWTFSGSAGYARPEFDVQRLVTVGASTTIASSSYRGDEWSAAAEAQYTLQFNGFQLKPLAGVRYVQLKQDGYTETGSLANLTVGAQRTESTVSLIGARYQRPVHDGRGTFEARAIWSHEFGDNSPSLNGRLAAVPGGTTFTVNGVPLKRDALTLGLGIASQVNKRLSLHLDGNVELRGSGQQQQALVAGLRYAW
jgi:outer membrane autotransporter protein